jgi:hypothetical protein
LLIGEQKWPRFLTSFGGNIKISKGRKGWDKRIKGETGAQIELPHNAVLSKANRQVCFRYSVKWKKDRESKKESE